MAPRRRSSRRFTKEFKADAVALVLDGHRSVASVARDLGIGATNLGNWVRQARIDRGDKPGLATAERAELVRLRRENARLRMERDLLKRATALGVPSRDSDPLSVGHCPGGRRVPDRGGVRCGEGEPSGVLRLASPPHCVAEPCGAGQRRAGRRESVHPRRLRRRLRVAADHRRAAPAGPACEPQTRRAADALLGIVGVHVRRRRRSRAGGGDTAGAPADLVRRDFGPGAPDTVWAGDITFIPTDQGWLHLAVVLDLGSRRLIGYSMAPDMRTRLVVDALDMATAARGGRTAGIVFHSDRGIRPVHVLGVHPTGLGLRARCVDGLDRGLFR